MVLSPSQDKDEYKTLFEQAPAGIIQTSVEGKFLKANTAFAKLLGYESPEDLLYSISHIGNQIYANPEDRQRFISLIETHSCGKMEYEAKHKNGSRVWLRVSARAVRDNAGKIIHFESVVDDVTNSHEREQRLSTSNQSLKSFAHAISHDLKEPLRTVNVGLQLLEEQSKQANEMNPEFLHNLRETLGRMWRLIDGLLSYSTADDESLPFGLVSCTEVINSTLENLKASIDQKRARIYVGAMPMIYGNEVLLIELFQNLIGNALKFCSQEPSISVEAKKEETSWIFLVKDNGIGIEPQHFTKIFQGFARLNAYDEFPGSGIGLSVCKRIVERLQGKIWVESKVGMGSIFYFSLPQHGVNIESDKLQASL